MTPRQFHNALRIIRGLGEGSLRQHGVIDKNWGTPEASSRDQLGAFFKDPYAEALKMPDNNFDRLFALIQSKQPTVDVPETEVPLTAAVLADALDCFWNAALGAATERQEGMATAQILVEGISAVSQRLKEQ